MPTNFRELHNNHIKKTKEKIEIEMHQLCKENIEFEAELRRAEDVREKLNKNRERMMQLTNLYSKGEEI